MSLRDSIKTFSSILPEIPKPIRKPSFKERIIWTAIALVLYLIMAEIPLYGVRTQGQDPLAFYRIIFAANRGTLMELGIGPIVTAGLISQLLVGSDIIRLDFSKPEDRSFFSAFTKVFTFIFIVLEATLYTLSGAIGVQLPLEQAVIVILELIGASVAVFMLDQMVQKGWGIGSGISLFILAGVALKFMLDMFSPLVAQEYYGFIPFLINSTMYGDFSRILFRGANLPALMGLISTLAFILFIVYLEGVRIELPVSSVRYRGFTGVYPIKLLYVSNIPVILVGALVADIQFFILLLSNWASNNPWLFWLGSFEQGMPTGGLLYYISPPGPLPISIHDPLRIFTYVAFMVFFSVLFAKLWVELGGMSPEKAAKSLLDAKVHLPGFRTTKSSIQYVLGKYIPTVTLLGGILIGLIASLSDLLGVYGSGIGILLMIDITINYYQMLVREHLEVLMPRLGGILGRR
jgi:preprotein translocase SecY subunit